MVKVQKPLPKSLSNGNKVEGVVKKKKTLEKSKKAALVPSAEQTFKKEKNVDPKRAGGIKGAKKNDSKEKEPLKLTTKPEPTKTQPKPAKKPLILAPAPSPVAATRVTPAAAKKIENIKKSKEIKKALVCAPPESPAVPPPAKKKLTKTVAKTSGDLAQENTAINKNVSKPLKTTQTKLTQPKGGHIKATKNPLNGVKNVAKNAKKAVVLKKQQKNGKQLKNKQKETIELDYELKPFDEEKYQKIVNQTKVQEIVEALKTQVATEVKTLKTNSIFSDYRYFLQVCSYKIPSCPKRMVKLGLKHSLVGADDDVAIIVTDLQRGSKFEIEPTIHHYEDLFREAGIKQHLKIVPFNQLRTEMVTFETRRRFLNTYDYLLCDGRLSGQATAHLGKFTQKPRNVLHSVRLSKGSKLKEEITRALCRTAYRQLNKGDLTSIPVGNHEHSTAQLAENIVNVTQQLQKVYPGGLANIRSLYVKIDIAGTSALPLYISMCAPPAETPYVVGPREQRMLKLKKQANEVLAKFALNKDADFIKLTPAQAKYKRELREKRKALITADNKAGQEKDGKDSAVPAKKARKEPKSKIDSKETDELRKLQPKADINPEDDVEEELDGVNAEDTDGDEQDLDDDEDQEDTEEEDDDDEEE